MSNKHPILGRGELYVKDIEKRYYGGPQKLPHTYHENKIVLIKDITSIQEKVQKNDEVFLQEKVQYPHLSTNSTALQCYNPVIGSKKVEP